MAVRRTPQPRRPNGSREMPARSIRVAEEPWALAKQRATFEGITMSNMAAQLIEGYGKGYIDLPKTQKVYGPTKGACNGSSAD